MSLSSLRGALLTDPLIVLATVAFGSVSLVVSFFDNTGRRQIDVARAWAKLLLKMAGVKVTVEGLEKIDPSGSYVFTSNHVSYMDTPVVLAHIPVQFRFLAKDELFKIPFLGDHLKSAGHVPVPRGNPRAAVKTMAEAARVIRERGVSLLIFPEGGRSSEGLQEFKEGAAYIAIKAGAQVVPLAVIGTGAIVPRGSLVVKPGPVTLRVGDPVPVTGLTLHDRTQLTDHLHVAVAALLETTPVIETFADKPVR
jgi:1-acyl-sn-glycerol-3-phosphate acyltransferase